MKMIKKVAGIGALVLSLAGCTDNKILNYQVYVDLNKDGKQDIVHADAFVGHYNRYYNLVVRNSKPDGSYNQPKLLIKLEYLLEQLHFTDLDGDSDVDLVYSKHGKRHLLSVDYDTFVAKNDGQGNFSTPLLLSRRTN